MSFNCRFSRKCNLMEIIEILRTVATLLLLEYGTVSQHVRHQNLKWQENIFCILTDKWWPEAAYVWDLPWQGRILNKAAHYTSNKNFDLYHCHSAPRCLSGFVMVFWPPQLSLVDALITTALLLPLSAIVWKLVKKSAGKEGWGSFWKALLTGRR